jgi:hypothetical protein
MQGLYKSCQNSLPQNSLTLKKATIRFAETLEETTFYYDLDLLIVKSIRHNNFRMEILDNLELIF